MSACPTAAFQACRRRQYGPRSWRAHPGGVIRLSLKLRRHILRAARVIMGNCEISQLIDIQDSKQLPAGFYLNIPFYAMGCLPNGY